MDPSWVWGSPFFFGQRWQRYATIHPATDPTPLISEWLGDSQERRLQRNGSVGGVEVEEIPRGSGVQHGDSRLFGMGKNPKKWMNLNGTIKHHKT